MTVAICYTLKGVANVSDEENELLKERTFIGKLLGHLQGGRKAFANALKVNPLFSKLETHCFFEI